MVSSELNVYDDITNANQQPFKMSKFPGQREHSSDSGANATFASQSVTLT